MSTSVLVIDPSPLVHRTVEASLGREIEIGSAKAVNQAIQALERQSWDLVMLATKMGDLDESFGLAQRIRSEWPTVRLVLMVGVMQEPSAAVLEVVQPDEIIRKPWASRDLQQLIESLVQQGPRAQEADPVSDSLPPVLVSDDIESPPMEDLPPKALETEPETPVVSGRALHSEALPPAPATLDEGTLPPLDESTLPPLDDDEMMVPAVSPEAMVSETPYDDDLPPLPELEAFEFETPATGDLVTNLESPGGGERVADEVSSEELDDPGVPVENEAQNAFDRLVPETPLDGPTPPPEAVDLPMDDLLSSVSDIEALPSLESNLDELSHGFGEEPEAATQVDPTETPGTDPPVEAAEEGLGTVPPDEAKQPAALADQLMPEEPHGAGFWEPQGTSRYGQGLSDDWLDAAEPGGEKASEAKLDAFDPSIQDSIVTMTAAPAADDLPTITALEDDVTFGEPVSGDVVVADALPADAVVADALPADAVVADALPADAVAPEALPALPVDIGTAQEGGLVTADEDASVQDEALRMAEAVSAVAEPVRPGVPEPSQEMVPIASAETVVAAEPIDSPPGRPGHIPAPSPPVLAAVQEPSVSAVDPEMIRQEVKEAVERMVWEMVPDLAEKIVRDEIRRLTDLPEER